MSSTFNNAFTFTFVHLSYLFYFKLNIVFFPLYNLYSIIKNLLFRYKFFIIPKKIKNREKRKRRLLHKINYKYFSYFFFLPTYNFKFKKLNTLKINSQNPKFFLRPFSPISSINNFTKVLTKYKIRAASVFLVKSIKNVYLNLYFTYWNLYKRSLTLSTKKIKYLPTKLDFNKKMFYRNTRVRSIWARHVSSFSLINVRKRLQFSLERHFLYQKPFTNFLLTLYRLKSTNFLYWNELKLVNILLKSSFFYYKEDIEFFLKKKLILLNYSPVYTILSNLKIYDILSIKYNIFTFNFFKKSLLGLNSLYFNYMHFYYKIQKKLFRKYPKTPTYRITSKIFKKKYFLILPAVYLEVDWLTLSLVLLNIYFFFKFYVFNSNVTNLANSAIRAYNWKYLN